MPDIWLVIKTGFMGGDHEKTIHIDDAEWETWAPETREQHAQEELTAFLAEEIETDWRYETAEDAQKYGDRKSVEGEE